MSILETLLKPFTHATRVALRPILHRQETINRILARRLHNMALDLTKLQTALTDVQAFVASHQSSNAADQAAVDGLAAQISAAVAPAAPVPPAPPAAS